MTRIVVKNSVDMRMLAMQVHKLQDLEKAMRDGETKERPNLSLKQLSNLFGFLKTDEDNQILSVEADYVEEDDDEGSGAGGEGHGGGVDIQGGGRSDEWGGKNWEGDNGKVVRFLPPDFSYNYVV